MKEKATSFDIAHLAGVSQSTVSRALSNSPLVNKETRERVQRIAKELNYKVDKNASNLRKQKSNTIALLLFEDPTSDDSMINPFFLNMLGSITRASSAAGYDLLVSFQNLDDDWHAEFEDSKKADGIILLGYGDYTAWRDKLAQLENQGTHFVRWGAKDEEHPGISIGCDNFQGGYDLTTHLVKNGHRRFAFIGDAGGHAPEFLARYQGYSQALKDAGIDAGDFIRIDANSTEEAGAQAIRKILHSEQKPDAVVCASDLIATGVLQALKETPYRVPQDIAVTGYDNISISAFTTPALTTVQQDTRLAGELLVTSLLKAINKQIVSDFLMSAELIIRESCGGKKY